MKILFLGDVFGKSGRCVLKKYIKSTALSYDYLIVNVENSAGGFGITRKVFNELKDAGVDFMTSGNHIWDNKDGVPLLSEFPDTIIRPANYPPGVSGEGFALVDVKGVKVAVINLLGRVFMEPLDDPFRKVTEIMSQIKSQNVKVVIVDFHAEATAEKQTLGWFLDGEVSVVLGTHTHVQTADERLLEKGTLYITDVGMCGSINSVIGINKEDALHRLRYQIPGKFTVASGNGEVQGLFFEVNEETGFVENFKRIKEFVECN